MALLFTSSEIEETIGLCDRVRIMFRGKSIREFQKGEAARVDVAVWVSGGNTSLRYDGVTSRVTDALLPDSSAAGSNVTRI